MPFVVTENCIKCKHTDCVEVCPVDCFHEGPNFLVIDPDECIDCTLCEPECPVNAIFAKVGTALEGVEGVTIASRAQLLGSYDVAYEGSNFLVRVVAVDAGAYISAVDPRGLPATAEAPVKLIATLKAKLAQ